MDTLLEKVFEPERWDEALLTGQEKDIDKRLLQKMCLPRNRQALKEKLRERKYKISAPHEARIPKENGDYRTVYVNAGLDRILLAIINDVIFELCRDMVHPACKSYQKGLSCGETVQEISRSLSGMDKGTIGVKIDLTKYFDSVPIRYIDNIFSQIRTRLGKSCILDMLQEYYHMDIVLDMEKRPVEKYSSLRQGCAFAAFLADASLYHIDSVLSAFNVVYARYSDDILILGDEWEDAYGMLKHMLSGMELALNPKKVETLDSSRWFKFLGFELKGNLISLSEKRIKSFQKSIEDCTIREPAGNVQDAISRVNKCLYTGPGGYSWATSVLPVITSQKDIQAMNGFIMDAIRASATKNTKIGGLGVSTTQEEGVIIRSKGRNVKQNKAKIPYLCNYTTLKCMQDALLASKHAFNLLVNTM